MTFTTRLKEEITKNDIGQIESLVELSAFIKYAGQIKKNKIKREPVYNARHTMYETIMRERIGTKVKIGTKKIEIPYDSDNDLDRILDILGISMDGE